MNGVNEASIRFPEENKQTVEKWQNPAAYSKEASTRRTRCEV